MRVDIRYYKSRYGFADGQAPANRLRLWCFMWVLRSRAPGNGPRRLSLRYRAEGCVKDLQEPTLA